jgi:hypothetical protein
VWDHTTDGLVEDAGWGTEMERTYLELEFALLIAFGSSWGIHTSSGWVVSGHLSEVGMVLYYNPSRSVSLFHCTIPIHISRIYPFPSE